MHVYHFSEDPTIERFEPRPSPVRTDLSPVVWAIDEWHAPMYYFPRDCPRIMLWPLQTNTPEDWQRWFGASEARMLAHIEWAWLERIRTTALYRYAFDGDGFEDLLDAGMHVSREAVTPASVKPVRNLLEALRAGNVELRCSNGSRRCEARGEPRCTRRGSGCGTRLGGSRAEVRRRPGARGRSRGRTSMTRRRGCSRTLECTRRGA